MYLYFEKNFEKNFKKNFKKKNKLIRFCLGILFFTLGLNFFSQFVALGKKESKADFVLIFEEQMISKFLQAKDRQLSFRSKKIIFYLNSVKFFLNSKKINSGQSFLLKTLKH